MSVASQEKARGRLNRGTKSPETGAPAEGPVQDAAVARPPKLRRRPVLIVASVAAVCLGALLGVLAFTSASSAEKVVAVRSTVHRGEVISRGDLMTVQVGVDPALKPVPADSLNSLVGKRAALDLAAGGLVTREDVTSAVVPAAGRSVVGVNLPPGGLPGETLRAGDHVRIVATPGAQGTYDPSKSPAEVEARVVGVRQGAQGGQLVVDVSVPRDLAADLAARAATGKVALILDARER